ncbi:MAG: hypothetical protein ACPLRW_12280 [Moorellales bacterium]
MGLEEIVLRGKRMAQALDGWKVFHSGGGIFLAVKDFPLKDGIGKAAVVVNGDSAAAYHRADDWVRADEYVGVLGHLEDAEEVILVWRKDDDLDCRVAEALFGSEVVAELKEVLASEVWN